MRNLRSLPLAFCPFRRFGHNNNNKAQSTHIIHYARSLVYGREDIGLLKKGCVRVERSGKFAQALPYPSSGGVMRASLMSFLSAQPV
jgi:hypothetical protein